MNDTNQQIRELLSQAMGVASLNGEVKCDCPACTGIFTEAEKADMKQRIAATLAKAASGKPAVSWIHLHGVDDSVFRSFTMTILSNHTHPGRPNLLVQVIDPELAKIMLERIWEHFDSGLVDLATMKHGHEFNIRFSLPVRLYKTSYEKLDWPIKNAIDASYEAADKPIEDLYQVILADETGKFPTDFGYNASGKMSWQELFGEY